MLPFPFSSSIHYILGIKSMFIFASNLPFVLPSPFLVPFSSFGEWNQGCFCLYSSPLLLTWAFPFPNEIKDPSLFPNGCSLLFFIPTPLNIALKYTLLLSIFLKTYFYNCPQYPLNIDVDAPFGIQFSICPQTPTPLNMGLKYTILLPVFNFSPDTYPSQNDSKIHHLASSFQFFSRHLLPLSTWL